MSLALVHRLEPAGLALLCTSLIGCPLSLAPVDPADGSSPEASTVDAGPCRSDQECSDGLYCNGDERCDPSAPGADARGCVAGTAVQCESTDLVCDEDTRRCVTACQCGPHARCEDSVCVDYTDLAVGFQYTCAITSGGDTYCWGNNGEGELGESGPAMELRPVRTALGLHADQITAGFDFACIRSSGEVYCWGVNNVGQVGDGTTTTPPEAVRVSGLSDAVEVRAGEASTCARRRNGQIECWGDNTNGALGDGTMNGHYTPALVQGIDGAVDLALGGRFGCARLRSGRLKCWGANFSGQLGNGPGADALVAVVVPGLEDSVSLAVGRAHACVLQSTGHVLCWGGQLVGELGIGSSDPQIRTPTTPVGLDTVSEIAAGDHYTCARQLDGEVLCWGEILGRAGQHPPEMFQADVPTRIDAPDDVVALALHVDHACLRRRDGAVDCWGGNELGQLGTGSQIGTLVPTPVIGLP